MKDLVLIGSLLCLVLLPMQAAAESAVNAVADPDVGQAIALPAAGAEPLAITATCTASCTDTGGSVSVSCSGTCTAVDQDCDSGERGYVQCNSNPPKYCAACVPCFAETFCPEGGSVYCTGWGAGNCMGGMGLCFVKCNDDYTFCPGHIGEIICE